MPHPLAPYARTAFAQGWAASGGPLTARVGAACTAAVQTACEHADHPGVLEATLRLGHLEGVWAAIYQRREQLHAEADTDGLAAWRDATDGLNLGPLIQQAQADGPTTDRAQHRRVLAALALAILGLLPATAQWEHLRALFAAAHDTARRYGWAAAGALLADDRGEIGPDLDQLAATAPDDTTGAAVVAAASALAAALRATANTLARTVTPDDPADTDNLDAATDDALQAGDDISLALDTSISLGWAAGMLAAISASSPQVSVITAGDGRVCPACEQAEADSPYLPGSAPPLPLHPRCRCSYTL